MFNWITQLFTGRETLRPAPHIEAVARHNGYTLPNLAEASAQARAYLRSPWVYVAVTRIAEAAALTPLSVYRLEGERRVPVVQHPIERLLDAPNPTLSRFDLLEQTIGWLELTGNAYWFLSGDGVSGVPREIWPLRPDRVAIVPDERQYVRGYIYEVDGVRVPLESVEVIHFKRWHPLNDYYGLSALEAASVAVGSDRAMAEWNRSTFGQDNGIPAGIVTLPETVTEADFKRIQQEWRSSYGGPKRRTAFLRAGGVSWQGIAHSHSDMEFLRGRQAVRDEILNMFGIPVGLVSDNATEANARVAERTFIERTLYPKLVRLAAKLTAELVPFYEQNAVIAFEDIRPTDTQARIQEIQTAYPALSVNEVRSRFYDLPPVPWGDLPSSHIEIPSVAVPDDAEIVRAQHAAPSDETSTDTKSAQLDELRQWEKFTLKRLGQSDARPFEVAHLPDDLAFEVSAGLLLAGEDTEAVKSVFRDVREVLTEPE